MSDLFLDFFSRKQNEETIRSIEENVIELEQCYFSYFTQVETFTHTDLRLNFQETKSEFLNFKNDFMEMTKDFEFLYKPDKHFFGQILTIEFKCRDRINRKELISFFTDKLDTLCKSQNPVTLKEFVKIIKVDANITDYITIQGNTIVFDKTYPVVLKPYFHIYTDIIDNEIKRPLRILNAKGKCGEFVSAVFNKLHYEPINKTRISRIHIKITDQEKHPIEFLSAPIIKIEIIK